MGIVGRINFFVLLNLELLRKMCPIQPPNFPPVKYDLQTRFGTIYDDAEKHAIDEVLARDAPTSDKKVVEFEKKFAEFCGTKYAITVSNGTAALQMAFNAIGIHPGDEIITTPITWIATAAAGVVLWAKIKFCDVDPNTLNMDPAILKGLITPKTKLICPVHLYGLPVDMDPILEIAHSEHISVIEDAAHAPGAKYHGKSTGNLGDLGCFSFHEQKNMSTLGEGGMVTTDSPELYERVRSYKSHCARVIGTSSKYLTFSDEIAKAALEKQQFWFQDFDDCGYNFRMNDITAAVGICQLEKLNRLNAIRIKIAEYLDNQLSNIPGISTPAEYIKHNFPTTTHVYHLYPIFLDPTQASIGRDQFIFRLRMEYGIKCGVHYMPLPQTTAFQKRGYSMSGCKNAQKKWESLVTLPIHPRMADDHLEYLITAIKNVMKN
jgi:dTDP-4-amino-4,6-dideoxygalactose transaminase